MEEPGVIGDRGIEGDARQVDEPGLRRVSCVCQRIEADAPPIGNGPGDIRLAAALDVRAKYGEALIGIRTERDIAFGHGAFMIRRQDQVLAALALVEPRRADILDRILPAIVHAAGDRTAFRRRNFQHHRPIPRVVEGVEVDRVGVRRQGLVFVIEQSGPIGHLVRRAACRDEGLEHQVEIHRGHAPDDRLDRAAIDGSPGDLLRRIGRGRLAESLARRDIVF